MINFQIIGRRIQRHRKQSALRQSEVAERLDVSIGYISQIERGTADVSLKRLYEISVIINANIEDLISDINEDSSNFLNSEIYQIIKNWDAKKKNMLLKIATVIGDENND